MTGLGSPLEQGPVSRLRAEARSTGSLPTCLCQVCCLIPPGCKSREAKTEALIAGRQGVMLGPWVRAELKGFEFLQGASSGSLVLLMERAWYVSFFRQGYQWKDPQCDTQGDDKTERSVWYEYHYLCCHIPSQAILVQKMPLLRSG